MSASAHLRAVDFGPSVVPVCCHHSYGSPLSHVTGAPSSSVRASTHRIRSPY